VRSFVDIAHRALLDGNANLALQSLLLISLRCWWSNPDQETRNLVVAAAERIPLPDDAPELINILAMAAPIERGASVIDRISLLSPDKFDDPGTALLIGIAATGVGAFDLSAGYLATAVAGLRAQGRLNLLAQALVFQAWAGIFLGTWTVALPAAEEAGRLAQETAQPRWAAAAQLAQAMVEAQRGEQDVAGALAAEAECVLLPMGANPMLALVQLGRGLAALGAGRHAEAYEQLRRIFDPADLAHHPYVRFWAVGDLAEAAVHSGHQVKARQVLEELEPLAAQTMAPILQVGLSFARPLLAEDDAAEPLFQAGLEADLTRWPFLRARLLLAYGAWLRRRRRVAESRAPLRAAREAFDALGAVPWGDRARQELRASGETSRKRNPGTWDQLSPQELQIAQMAAEGLSNREIGQRLYLSHRTVGSHLYRIFPKLGITSRSELRTLPGL
jgi:ATP/maltotriose-dependent transcriptional regulator MalT